MDARRHDQSVVAVKWIPDAEATRDELEITCFLSSDALREDPRNHAVPLLDTFSHTVTPNGILIFTPWLGSLIQLDVERVNELADFMLQTFEVRSSPVL